MMTLDRTVDSSRLDGLLAALCEPSLAGMMVTAGVGMGKTTLGTAMAQALAPEYKVFWMTGRSLLAQLPLAVLETFCPELRPAAGEDTRVTTMNVVQALYDHLLGAAAGKPPLLIVDDAQWVDEESCAVLEQLAVSGDIRMLLMCQPGAGSVARSPLFTDDTLMHQHALTTLSGAEVLDCCELRLQGKIVPGAAAIFAKLSGGHPLFLQVLLDAAVASQAFVAHNNIWALTTVPAEPDPVVCDVALDLFNDCSKEEQVILETVALAEPVSTAVLHRLVPGVDHGSLIEAGILRRVPQALDTLEFVSPVFGQSLRQRIPVGQSVQIRQNVLTARSTLPLTSDALMRHAGWGLDCGQHIPDRQLLHSARIANLRNKSRLALRLAATVSDPGLVFAARCESILAHSKLEQFAHCWALLDSLLTDCATGAEFDAAASLTVVVALKEGHAGRKLEQLAVMWRNAYQKLGRDTCPGADLVTALVRVNSGCVLPATTQDRLRGIANTPGQVGLQFAATALLAVAGVIEGRHAVAQADFATAITLMQQNPGRLGMFSSALFTQHTACLASMGETSQVPELMGDSSPDKANSRSAQELGGVSELITAVEELRLGKAKAAVASFDVAVAALREHDPSGLLPCALASSAYAFHLLGQQDRAAVLAREFTATTAVDEAPFWLLSKAYVAATGFSGAKPEAVYAALKDLAEQARRQGAVAMELAILDVLLRAGCTARLQRMMDVSAAVDGPTAALRHAVARGFLMDDADALAGAARMPAAHHDKLLAAEALSYALGIHHRRGNNSAKAAVLVQLRQLQFPFQATGSAAIMELAALAELTAREKEIADLVHGRYSNKEIAEKFTLSQRTIEGHLYRIYSKLGVGSREELHQVWLPEASHRADK